MVIKIVTDSSADLPPQLAEELGITIVPLYIRFGDKIYRDRLDIGDEEFYRELLQNAVHPVTVQPGIQDFVEVYQRVAIKADAIVSIHISSKLSGTYNSALQATAMVDPGCPVEVIDSQTTTAALGLICVEAAKAANSGKDLQYVISIVEEAIQNTYVFGILDSLEYICMGGRAGRTRSLLSSILNVKPVLSLRNGELTPVGRVRTRSRGIDELFEYVTHAKHIDNLAVAYSTTAEEAADLSQRLAVRFKKKNIITVRLGSTIGVHTGPGTVIVAFRGNMNNSHPQN
jgi:DegV family protein with EDD domain